MKKTATYTIYIFIFVCLIFGFYLDNNTENLQIKVFLAFALILIGVRGLIFLKDE
jgi:hypothetical protein